MSILVPFTKYYTHGYVKKHELIGSRGVYWGRREEVPSEFRLLNL